MGRSMGYGFSPTFSKKMLMIHVWMIMQSSAIGNENDAVANNFPIEPPHCTKTHLISARTSKAETSSAGSTQVKFQIGLHTAVCFRLYDGRSQRQNSTDENVNVSLSRKKEDKNATSLLHTIRLDSLEHYHPITQNYTFGIPEVQAHCICECDSQSDLCAAETYQFTSCADVDENGTSCYKTFFPNQSPNGCELEEIPNLCCDVKFKPLKELIFMAVKLEQPTTFAKFVYTAYDFVDGKWIEKEKSTFNSQLDGGTQNNKIGAIQSVFLDVNADGRASHQLETGMYFMQIKTNGELGELRKQKLNEVSENNFNRLGWYRMDNSGNFYVNDGAIKVNDVHKAKVKNCQQQTYKTIFAAKHHMPGHFRMQDMLKVTQTWIHSARVPDISARQAVVKHAEGTNLRLSLNSGNDDNETRLIFFHNVSRIRDFSGKIVVDAKSNRYIYLTVYDALGKLDGSVKNSTDRNSSNIYTFTTYVNTRQASSLPRIIPLPASVKFGSRLVCLKTDEIEERNSICQIFEYQERPLEIDLVEGLWTDRKGNCPKCNRRLWAWLKKWLDPYRIWELVSWAGELATVHRSYVMIVCAIVIFVALYYLYKSLCFCLAPISCCFSILCCPIFYFGRKVQNKLRKRNNDKNREKSEKSRNDSDEQPIILNRLRHSNPDRCHDLSDDYI